MAMNIEQLKEMFGEAAAPMIAQLLAQQAADLKASQNVSDEKVPASERRWRVDSVELNYYPANRGRNANYGLIVRGTRVSKTGAEIMGVGKKPVLLGGGSGVSYEQIYGIVSWLDEHPTEKAAFLAFADHYAKTESETEKAAARERAQSRIKA